MSTNVPKSYLDLARSVIDTQIGAKENVCRDDAIFGLMSCTYVYSYSALVSFCTAQLYLMWQENDSSLKKKYSECLSFESLMASSLKDVKSALREVTLQKGIKPIHEAEPQLWQHLNEFVKQYRDFFLHPNPELFEEYVGKAGNAQWQLPSATASGLLAYIYRESTGAIPNWVNTSELKSHGFEIRTI